MKVKKLQVKMDIICGQGKLQIQMRARNGIRQARKGIKADKEWHKSRQGKVQRRKEKYKGRPEKVQVQEQQARKTKI